MQFVLGWYFLFSFQYPLSGVFWFSKPLPLKKKPYPFLQQMLFKTGRIRNQKQIQVDPADRAIDQ